MNVCSPHMWLHRGSRSACRASRWHRQLTGRPSSTSPSMQMAPSCSRVSSVLSRLLCLPCAFVDFINRCTAELWFLCNNRDENLFTGMITIPASSLAGAQIVQAGGANTNTTNSGQGTVTVTLPVSGNMVNAGGMVMVRPCAEVSSILLPFLFFIFFGRLTKGCVLW